VVAIELDRDLVPYLRDRYREAGNVEVIERDVLELTLADVAGGDFLLAGERSRTTSRRLFSSTRWRRLVRHVLSISSSAKSPNASSQPPGSRTYGALSVNVQGFAYAELVGRVPAGAFRPPPAVESAILRVTPREHAGGAAVAGAGVQSAGAGSLRTAPQADASRRRTGRLARSGSRRTSRSSPQGIDPESRPETLGPEDFARLLAQLQPLRGARDVSDPGS
jgi:16S rRNA (adenine1518-N6/adenine1519-N6)-dimethyltransferase